MKRRPWSFFSCPGAEEEGSQDASVCRTREPGKCPPVVMAVIPGTISFGSEKRNLRIPQTSSRCNHSLSSPETYTGHPNSWPQVRWVV